jgi:hypothetical protein
MYLKTKYNSALYSALPDVKRIQGDDLLFYSSLSNLRVAVKYIDLPEKYKALIIESDLTSIDLKNKKYTFKTKPYVNQEQCFLESRNKLAIALFAEPRTGKTKVIIDTLNYLYENKILATLVIVAPNIVHKQWEKELILHSKEEFNFSYAPEKMDLNPKTGKKLNVYSFYYENFSRAGNKYFPLVKEILTKNKCLFVLDESHRIKTPSSESTKELTELGKLTNWKRILTGTPVEKDFSGYYSQFNFLNPNYLGFKSYHSFLERYAILDRRFHSQIIGEKNMDELMQVISNYSYRMEKLIVPKLIRKQENYELTPEQQVEYKKVKNNLIAYLLNKKTIEIALTGAARMVKLFQICNGFLQKSPKEIEQLELYSIKAKPLTQIIPIEKDNKLKLLLSILKEYKGKKIIIFTHFIEEKKRIISFLELKSKKELPFIVSDFKEENKTQALNDYLNGKANIFISNIKSGGTGLTLKNTDVTIFYSNSWSYTDRKQGEERMFNPEKEQIIIDLCCLKTVENSLLRILANKGSFLQEKKNWSKLV